MKGHNGDFLVILWAMLALIVAAWVTREINTQAIKTDNELRSLRVETRKALDRHERYLQIIDADVERLRQLGR